MPAPSSPLRVSIEQAALSALQRHLEAALPAYTYDATTNTDDGVLVSDRWPDPDKRLPGRAITILRAGAPTEESTQPSVVGYEAIHVSVSTPPRLAAPSDLPTALQVLNTCRASYEAHRASTAAHQTADTAHAITAPAAIDQPSAEALANDLRTQVAAHLPSAAHAAPDGVNPLAALPVVTPSSLPSLLVFAAAILQALAQHYVARIYLWRVAESDLPLQLDVWATQDIGRDDVMARLVEILHDGSTLGSDNPAAEYLTLTLGDGWQGTAEASFDAPSTSDGADAKKRSEYRATYAGKLTVSRIVRAQSPRLTRAQLQLTAAGHTGTATVAQAGTATTTTIVLP